MLRQLRQLERRYSDELVVIGVHSGKFTAERDTENIRQAVVRLGVEHPVANDRAFRTWRAYGVNAWPTLILIDPEGRVVDAHPGELDPAAYQPMLDMVVDEADRRGTLRREPFRPELETEAQPRGHLAFPGKVLAAGQRLFIADTGHNRILVLSLQEGGGPAVLEAIAGLGTPGMEDGGLDRATFNAPQGLAVQEGMLFVADAGNHAIRALGLARRQVTTLAGTGEPMGGLFRAGFGPRMPLKSPWDLAVDGAGLYIAMAGTHQIWRLGLDTSELQPYAGGGAEELIDGAGENAALAQPSGLSAGGGQLYFADSESSAIREVGLGGRAAVRTIVGTGLFDFGDRDGSGGQARLQHPQGVAWHDGMLYVADTYNNKIKAVNPMTRLAQTFTGRAEAGYRDGVDPLFYEPGGISAQDGRLYVADTNNHAIRVIELATRQVSTLQMEIPT